VFVAIGAAFAIGSLRYELGTILAMGPGYVPLLVSCVLVALGVAVIVKAYVAPDTAVPGQAAEGEEAGPAVPTSVSLRTLDLRATALITAAPVFFGATVSGLGLLPATFGAGLLAAFARKETTILRAALVAAGLTLASYVIFVVLLQVRVGLLGDWIGG
jgi:hypothetical protein